MPVKAILFDAEGRDKEVKLRAGIVKDLGENQLLWVDMRNASEDEIKEVGKTFGLDEECVRDLAEVHHRPELRNYGEYFHLQVIGVARTKDKDEPVHLDMVAGENFVVTVQQEDLKLLDDFNEQVRGDTKIGRLGSADFVAALLDLHLDSYYHSLNVMEDQIDRFDDAALQGELSSKTEISSLVGMRRWVRHLRRLLIPHRDVYGRLARPDFAQFFNDGTAGYIDTLNNRLDKAIEAVENARDMVFGSFDILMAQSAENTNNIVKVLTVITLAAALVGVVAGTLGMNFAAGIFDTGDIGFFVTLGTMVIIIVAVIVIARVRDWI
ncbi:MAG TPA: CorA family divalent cation transporter [Chloroflexia bacterium]|nr:CorA family divalent cation transporter [Chloroflexia bacterium]